MTRHAWKAQAGVCTQCHYHGLARQVLFRAGDILVRAGVRLHGAMTSKTPKRI